LVDFNGNQAVREVEINTANGGIEYLLVNSTQYEARS